MNNNPADNENVNKTVVAESSTEATAAPVQAQPTAAQYFGYPPSTAPSQSEQKKERRRAMAREAAEKLPMLTIAPLTLLLGMLYSWLFMRSGTGLGLTVVTLLFYVIYGAFIIKRGANRVWTVALGIPVLLTTLSFAFNSSIGFTKFVMLVLLAVMFCLHITVLSGSTKAENPLSFRGATDAAYTTLGAPFTNMGISLGAMFKGKKNNEKSGVAGGAGKIFIGLILSLPIAVVLLALLTSADAVFLEFTDSLEKYFEKLDINFGDFIVDGIHGVLFMLFVIPLVVSLRSSFVKNDKEREPKRWLDPIIAATVSFVSAIIFVAFVAVQLSYFFPVSLSYYFSNIDYSNRIKLPNDMTWAEYARGGFFELSAVVILSFLAIAFFMAFCKTDKNGKMSVFLRVILTVIAVCNLIMSFSAVLRMSLYTIWCGLTVKRIGVLLIIAVMAVSLICAAIKLWSKRFPIVKLIGATALCAAVVFCCMDIDRVCAEVNVDRHLEDGTSIDIGYLGNLSYGAAPAVERLMLESPDVDVSRAARGILVKYLEYGQGKQEEAVGDYAVGAITRDRLVAEKICEKYFDEAFAESKQKNSFLNEFSDYANWQENKRNYERAAEYDENYKPADFKSFREYQYELKQRRGDAPRYKSYLGY